MGETYRDKFGGDAVAIAIATRLKNRERRMRMGTIAPDGTNLRWKDRLVVEEKRKPVVQPDKGDGKVGITILVDFGDRSIELNYRTNMRTTLMAPQMSEEALRERFAKLMKENFGLSK